MFLYGYINTKQYFNKLTFFMENRNRFSDPLIIYKKTTLVYLLSICFVACQVQSVASVHYILATY